MTALQEKYMSTFHINSVSEHLKSPQNSHKYRRTGFDRRLGIDRRSKISIKYFLGGKSNRRKSQERRHQVEKRAGWVKSGKWTSVCSLFITKVEF